MTPRTAADQVSLSFTTSWDLLKLTFIESTLSFLASTAPPHSCLFRGSPSPSQETSKGPLQALPSVITLLLIGRQVRDFPGWSCG